MTILSGKVAVSDVPSGVGNGRHPASVESGTKRLILLDNLMPLIYKALKMNVKNKASEIIICETRGRDLRQRQAVEFLPGDSYGRPCFSWLVLQLAALWLRS